MHHGISVKLSISKVNLSEYCVALVIVNLFNVWNSWILTIMPNHLLILVEFGKVVVDAYMSYIDGKLSTGLYASTQLPGFIS